MEKIDSITEVPAVLADVFPNVEVLRAELKLAVKNLERNEQLMAMVFKDQTEESMKAIRTEIKAIGEAMNKVMHTRFGDVSFASTGKVLAFADLMNKFSNKSALTIEQRTALVNTGAIGDLLHG